MNSPIEPRYEFVNASFRQQGRGFLGLYQQIQRLQALNRVGVGE